MRCLLAECKIWNAAGAGPLLIHAGSGLVCAPLALAASVKDTSHPPAPLLAAPRQRPLFWATCVDGFIAVFGFSFEIEKQTSR